MIIVGIILVSLGIIFRIIKTVGMKIRDAVKGEKPKEKSSVPRNYYLSYFLVVLAFICTLVGLMTMPST